MFITEKGLVNSSAAMVKEGDILYALYGATSGEVSRSKLKGAINQAILAILPKAKYDSEYIAQWLKTKKRCIVDTYLQGGQGNLSGNIVKNFIVDFSSYNEQLSIGNFASSLDHLITLHQSKFFGHILKVIVSYTLYWEQRKLGEVVREVTRVDENSKAPVMMITANDGFIEQSERYSTDNAGKSLKKYILLKKWELAYNHGASKIRPFGSCFALTRATNIRIPFVYHCFLALEDNPEFLEQILNGKSVENQLRKIVSSGARMDGLLNISFQEYTSIFIRCPIRKEQDKIAKLIKSLDHLITLHQLEPYKLIFKAIAYRIIDYAKSKPLSSIK